MRIAIDTVESGVWTFPTFKNQRDPYMFNTLNSLVSAEASAYDLPEPSHTDPHELERFPGIPTVGVDSTPPHDNMYRSANYWGIQALRTFGYDPQRFLDSGGIAMVRRAKLHETGQVVALKSIRRKRGREKIRAQYSLLLTLRHCNIICPYAIIETPHDTWLCMEFCECGDLFTYTCTHGSFPDAKAQELFVQLLTGVDFLHQNGIAHLNLRPSNVLLATSQDWGFRASHLRRSSARRQAQAD